MDFRRRKLFLTLRITAVGMFIALLWHGWQGWGLGRGYPYNTFLFIPPQRFSDLIAPVGSSLLPSPYQDNYSDYFPFTYWALKYIAFLTPQTASYLFLGLSLAGLLAVLLEVLQPLVPRTAERLLCATGLLVLSYPVLFCLDRANIEIGMVFLVATALLYFRHRNWIPGLAWLLPAICLKLYPILLCALFVRRKHLVKIAFIGVAFLIVSLCCLSSFAFTWEKNWHLWQGNLRYYLEQYVIYDWGLAGSASPWNTLKAPLIFGYFMAEPFMDPNHPHNFLGVIRMVYHGYAIVALGCIVGVTLYAILVEREFFRRAILLLLLITMSAPSGGDYKLLFANLALVVHILLPGRRRHDLMVTGLLAFVIVPKKEIFLTFLGTTDTGVADIPIAILLNPPCLILVIGLLIRDGIQAATRKQIRVRFLGVIKLFRYPIMKAPRKRQAVRMKLSGHDKTPLIQTETT